jgi:hypothetical protein
LEARVLVRGCRGFSLCLGVAIATATGTASGAEPSKTTPATATPPAAATPPGTATTAPATSEPPVEAAPPAAAGDPATEQCVVANETAQRLLRAGSLAAAREQVNLCVAATCPELIRNDCNELSKAIQAAMPTVRFDARDKSGAVVTNVRVTMDGQVLAENLDGTPLAVDPGKHRFVFESPGLPRTTKTILLKAGEQRGERVDMIDMTGPLLRTTGLVVAGIGVIAIGYGTFRAIRAKTTYDDAVEHCPNGPNSCSPAGVRGGEDAHDDAAAATTTIGIGAFLVAGGAALYFLVPEEGFRITPGVRSGGLSLEASATW